MSSNKVLFEYSLAFELWAMKRCFLLPLMKLAPHGTDQLWHWMWGTQRISSLFIDTSCPNSSLASEWSNEGAGAAAECGAFLAGAGASQWSHHRIWDQVLRESKWERTAVWMAPDAIPALSAGAGHCATVWGHSRLPVYHSLFLITTSTTSASRLQPRSLLISFLCHTSENTGIIFFQFFNMIVRYRML